MISVFYDNTYCMSFRLLSSLLGVPVGIVGNLVGLVGGIVRFVGRLVDQICLDPSRSV